MQELLPSRVPLVQVLTWRLSDMDTVTFTGFIWTLDQMVQNLNSKELKP